jgi:predicted GNAT superfamily acetyltransferase
MSQRFSNEYGYFELNQFPCCSQIAVSNHATVFKRHRGQGHGHRNHNLRVERAKILGFDYLMCTVQATNEAQLSIMKEGGFKELDRFMNSETEHEIIIFGKKLN